MPDRRSEIDSFDIKARLREIQKEEQRLQQCLPGTHVFNTNDVCKDCGLTKKEINGTD